MIHHRSSATGPANREIVTRTELVAVEGNAPAFPASDVILKGHRATVTWMDPDLLSGVDPRAIYGVGVVAFSGDDEIVMVRLNRGIEIPAGTVEAADTSLEHTARREAWEEACITLGQLHLVQLMRVEWHDLAKPAVYVPIYAGKVASMPPFAQRHETYGRIIVSCRQYVDVLGFGTRRDRERLIANAKSAVYQRFPACSSWL